MGLPTRNDDAIIAQLCVTLHKLPYEIEQSDYNGIENIIAVLKAQNKRQKKDSNQ